MPTLAKELRNTLAKVTLDARARSEAAARAALENLAVHEREPRGHMAVPQRKLRNRLRARGRALGDTLDERSGQQNIDHLTEAVAYEQWHRLLFTRFLTENNLLLMPDEHGGTPVPVTVEECEELAAEMGARDGFDLACRFAGKTLPGVFRADDAALELSLALNDQVELRSLLAKLPSVVFTATDSLGWTYQFWQTQRKEEINKSGKKIGADELPAVTQLFTEDYMVEFLLHNTLGAWWAGKLGPIRAATEEEARAKAALPVKGGLGITWTYLRFIQDEKTKTWSPAAGTFSGWPRLAKLITFLDPCMGSGHFVVFALPLLARMRMGEEGLSAAEAVHATLRDNVFGLELDERCAQIAAFNLALTAWKLGGCQSLPPLHLACSGLAPHASEKDWVALADDPDSANPKSEIRDPKLEGRLQRGMARLYALFKDAPVLGSLINPRATGGDLIDADFHELRPLLEKALAQESKDDTTHEMAVTARGLAKAAEILGCQFTLVATNVPYLGRGKQNEVLQDYCERLHSDAKADLATCFVERCLGFCYPSGSTALVTPQNWLFLGIYTRLRENLLRQESWACVARLGPRAFETIGGEIVNVALVSFSREQPGAEHRLTGIMAADEKTPAKKNLALRGKLVLSVNQARQLENPDSRITLVENDLSALLSNIASFASGMLTGDGNRFLQSFWEPSRLAPDWECMQSSVLLPELYGGRSQVVYWQQGVGELFEAAQSVKHLNTAVQRWRTGQEVWGKRGIVVSRMSDLACTIYLGDRYDDNVGVICPHEQSLLAAVWCYCSSPQFAAGVRNIDQALKVTNSSLVKVPFDLAHWQKVAAEKYPHGLPKPFSSDPTQWLFNGQPKGSDQPLHVAVARLLGYQWPRQTGSSFPDCPSLRPDGLEKLADEDGIVCLPPINREQPAAHRLRALLVQALGQCDERTLLTGAGPKGSKSITLEDWLRDEFFEQHCDLFDQRPFIWHVWDGRKDGFHVFCNYHKLDYATLQKLTYSILGEWIRQQDEDAKAEKPGADARLGAARALQTELAKILEGEATYDIFVRWKPLAKQATGWHPALNDGVRLNIRPFMCAADVGKKGAGLLRTKPNIKWDKDRGTEPQRDKSGYPWFWCAEDPGADPKPGKEFTGNRWNDVHLTLATKRAARGK